MKELKRKISRLFKKIGKIIPAILSLVFTAGKFGLNFLKDNSDVLLLGRYKLTSYDIANFTWWASFSVFLFFTILWAWSKNAPPLVQVEEYTPNGNLGETYIQIKNIKENDVKKVSVRLVEWVDMDSARANFDFTKPMGKNNFIKVDTDIVPEETAQISIAKVSGFDGMIWLPLVEFGYFPIEMRDTESVEAVSNYKILMEVFVLLADESKSESVGFYEGVIIHKRLNGLDAEIKGKGKQVIKDKIYQEMVFWEKGSFRKIEDKKELKAVTKLSEGSAL